MKRVKDVDQAISDCGPKEDSLEPGIYRMVATACEVKRKRSQVVKCFLEFQPLDPHHSAQRAVIEVELGNEADRARAVQMYEMTGIMIEDEHDVNSACVEMLGREYYVELLRDGRFHVQQLATTHHMTTPMPGKIGQIAAGASRIRARRDDGPKNMRNKRA
jgi:hypothetical protein